MDPNSSTFCVNYLSQFPLIKPETINTLCFNGFTNYHQLAQLDESDLPFIRDISGDQKAAVKRALIRFAGHTNGNATDGVTIASSTNGANASTDSVNSGSRNTTNGLILKSGNTTRVESSNGTIGAAGNSAPNSFYSINESSTTVAAAVVEVTAAATAPLDGSNSSTGNSTIGSHFSNSVSQTANGTECHTCPLPTCTASVSNTTAATRSSTEVIAAAATGSTANSPSTQLILLAGKNNSSSTSSIYQRIDQFNLPGSSNINNHDGSGNNKYGSSKLGEASNNFVTASNTGSLSKRRKQNETVTAAVNSATLSLPSSTSPLSSSSSSSSSLLYSKYSKPSDLEKSLTGETGNHESSTKYKRPKRLVRVLGSAATQSVECSENTSSHLAIAPVCTVQIPNPATFANEPSECPVVTRVKQESDSESLSGALSHSFTQNEDQPVLETVTRMPYAILEQLDCTKKLENGQKPLLYHFGTAESNDSKKELITDSGRSLSAHGEVNYLVASKLNSPSPASQYEALSSSNLNLIIDPSTLNFANKSPPVATSNNTSAVASINSSICSTSVSPSVDTGQSIAITSQSTNNLLNALHMPSNVVVSSDNTILQSDLQSSTLASLSNSANSLSEPMQIRDYLSEINVVPVSSNGLTNTNSVVDTSGHTVLTNSVANFINHDHHLMKNGGIIVDQNGQPLDPNSYVYSTLQLQLAPTPDANKSSMDPSKSHTPSIFTLGPANLQTSLSPTQQPPIGQQVVNAVQQQQQQQQQQNNAASRRGRGRPKKYSDPLSLAVEQCLENSNSPTQSTPVTGATQFTGTIANSPGSPSMHHCRWQGCNFSSCDILEFRNHNRTQHRDESTIIPSRKGKSSAPKEPLVCEVPGCGYSPKYRRLLIDHQNAHKGLRAHKCCFCEYNSSYFGDIRKHMIKKHPDLAQEIKLSKLKLKQNGLDGKGSKLSKAELDELTHKMSPDVKNKKGSGDSGLDNGNTKKRNYSKKSKKAKKDENTASGTTFGTMTGNEAKPTLAISNLNIAGAAQQATNAQQQPQYSFMTTPGYGHLQLNNVTGGQSEHHQLVSNNGTWNSLVPQTAIIYLQTSPTSGNTVQLSANDLSSLNQLIGYTDINSLNGQIAMASGHHQIQNIGASFATQQQAQLQGQQQGRTLHETNGLTSICLDGNGSGGQATLAFVTDPHQQAHHQQANATTTTIYKCDYPSCYYQTDQYEVMLLHKHRDHSASNQNQAGTGQQQQQQITIIDASTLAAAVANNSQQLSALNPNNHQPQVSQHQVSSHPGHHQLTSVNTNTNVVSSSVYALASSNSVSSANFVHGLDYGSMSTTTTANIANQVTSGSPANSHNPSSTSSATSQCSSSNVSTNLNAANIPNGSNGGGHLLDMSGVTNSAVANMIFASDPNAIFFNTLTGEHHHQHPHSAHQHIVTAINGNSAMLSNGTLVAVSSAASSQPASSSPASSTSSLVAAAVASAGLADSSVGK